MRCDDRSRGEKREGGGERESFEDTIYLALKMQEGPTSQGIQAASGSWEGQKKKQILS